MSGVGRRLVKVGGGQLEIETFEVPEPGPGEVLMRVHRSQVSAGTEKTGLVRDRESPESAASQKSTQLASYARVSYEPQNEAQRFAGYTTVGRVQAAGTGMEEYKPGDRVLAFGIHGSHWLTPRPVDLPGSPSEAKSAIERIEYDITDEQAAFSRLGDVSLNGVRHAELQIDESVAVFGQGVVGQFVTAICRLSGAYPVIARRPGRRPSGACQTERCDTHRRCLQGERRRGGAIDNGRWSAERHSRHPVLQDPGRLHGGGSRPGQGGCGRIPIGHRGNRTPAFARQGASDPRLFFKRGVWAARIRTGRGPASATARPL